LSKEKEKEKEESLPLMVEVYIGTKELTKFPAGAKRTA
jgi:hypothetical protein